MKPKPNKAAPNRASVPGSGIGAAVTVPAPINWPVEKETASTSEPSEAFGQLTLVIRRGMYVAV
jgi:hypothetical protein